MPNIPASIPPPLQKRLVVGPIIVLHKQKLSTTLSVGGDISRMALLTHLCPLAYNSLLTMVIKAVLS